MDPTPSLLARVIPLLQTGFGVGAVRYALEFIAPRHAQWIGLHLAMPVALLVIGIRGTWGRIHWRALAGTMILAAMLSWGIWNSFAYTTGQFLGWRHGRFPAEHAATAPGKVGRGVALGALSAIPGSVWCVAFGTVLVWLPGVIRSRREARGRSVASN